MHTSAIEEAFGMLDRDFLASVARRGPSPVFASVSGAHLYGFASRDSDVDLRGAFVRPVSEVLGLFPKDETLTVVDTTVVDLDWVAHDVRKFCRLMTGHNGYVLEQLYSPLVVVETEALRELRELGRGCITRPTVRHYLGFAHGRRKRLMEPDPTVKHLLYAYRVYLSGIHLMRTGEIEAHLGTLNDTYRRPEIDDLVARKREGAEKMKLDPGELDRHASLLDALERELDEAHARSRLPDEPTTVRELDAFVVRLRLTGECA